MTVSNGERNLHEPVEHLCFVEKDAILLLDSLSQVATLAELHQNVEPVVALEAAFIADDIRMR